MRVRHSATCLQPAAGSSRGRTCVVVMLSAGRLSLSLQDGIFQLLNPQKVLFLTQVQLNQLKAGLDSRVLVMTPWRAYVFHCRQPVKLDSSFSYLEIYAITIGSLNQMVIDTDKQSYTFNLMTMEDLEAVVSHVTASLKKIFPDSSPGKLLKKVPTELQEQLRRLTAHVEEQLSSTQGPCGGFSETYAALCDFNEFPCREEVQWDVDNIYHVQSCRDFNLLEFSHLDSRDLALAVAALSFNQWFTRISNRDFRLNPDVQEQVLYMINRSPKLEEVCLENSGLRSDFALRMAWALRDHSGSMLHTINLSANQIEDKGVAALCQQLDKLPHGLVQLSLAKVSLSSRGVANLAQAFSHKSFPTSLQHLDLSGNAGCLAMEEAECLFKFLSGENIVSYLDLSGTDCPLDTLFVSLSHGCYTKMTHLNLSKTTFSHRKVKDVTRSVRDFFRKSEKLKYVGLAGTRLPAEALRLLLQGLATNTHLSGLQLDLSSCELRSAGAQVIQEHIFEAKAINSLDLSDNGLESDMVTVILAIGRSHSIRHLALGRNFAMKSRMLTDVLHRLVQLIQEEECPLESLSVSGSKLKTGTTILINSLGCNSTLTKMDISGNYIGDTGAKMLAKALLINTKLKTLVWDKNSVTASGFMDVANALDKNSTLQYMSFPVSDASQAYRSNPEKTEEALQKIQTYLLRNSQKQEVMSDHVLKLQQSLRISQSEQRVQNHCLKVQESMRPLSTCSMPEVQTDVLHAEEVLGHARTSLNLLPTLFELGRAPPSSDVLQNILKDTARVVTSEVVGEVQELVQTMLQSAQTVCPRVVQRSSVNEQVAVCVDRMSRQVAFFFQDMFVEQMGQLVKSRLRELRQAVSMSLAESIVTEVTQDLSISQQKLERHIKEHTQTLPGSASSTPRTNIPQLRLVEAEFPTDEYVPVIWHSGFPTGSIRPAPSVKSLLDSETDSPANESAAGQLKPHPGEDTVAHSSTGPLEPAGQQPILELPVESQTLRHHTLSRPRPQRIHRHPPSKRQVELLTEGENLASENDGRVDEGLEEFFTKKVLPENCPSLQAPELPAKPDNLGGKLAASKDLRKKSRDFFAFKRVFAGRPCKGEGAPEQTIKKTCIADLIRPLRMAVRPEKERDSERATVAEEPAKAPVPLQRDAANPYVQVPARLRPPEASQRGLRAAKAQSLIMLPSADSGGSDKLTGSPPVLHDALQPMAVSRTVLLSGAKPSQESEPRKGVSEDHRNQSRSSTTSLESHRVQPSPEWLAPPNRPCPPAPTRPICKPPSLSPEAPVAPPRQKHLSNPTRRREAPPIPTTPWDGRDRAQSVTEADSLPNRRPRTKPSPRRHTTSVHEEVLRKQMALLNPEELMAVPPRPLRSPIHKRPPPQEPHGQEALEKWTGQTSGGGRPREEESTKERGRMITPDQTRLEAERADASPPPLPQKPMD
nr:capping protein, Arp2/3 and myosin-I linker protein 3-like isoform X4 [Paramormyrops kingsleyae]